MSEHIAIIEAIKSGSMDEGDIAELSDILGLAEVAITSGNDEVVAVLKSVCDSAGAHFIEFREAQSKGDVEASMIAINKSLKAARDAKNRDHYLEARARMELGLLKFTQGEIDDSGVDIKWAMERLSAVSPGSSAHGVSILNMAAWHEARGEPIMALAQHASISRVGEHSPGVVAISRSNAARICVQIGDIVTALRHSWVSFSMALEQGMDELTLDSGLVWIDLALSEVNEEATRMEELVLSAAPRELGDNPKAWAHPEDLRFVVERCSSLWNRPMDGSRRPDIMVLLEGEAACGFTSFHKSVNASDEVEDEVVLGLIQG